MILQGEPSEEVATAIKGSIVKLVDGAKVARLGVGVVD